MKKAMYLILLAVFIFIPPSVSALTYEDPYGGHVNFYQIDNQLVVDLWSTRTATVNSEVLTAVFFSLGGVTLSPSSAIIPTGSIIVYNDHNTSPTLSPINAGQEWAYRTGLAGQLPGGGSTGISTAGFGIFGPGNLFPGGVDLNGSQGPNGGDYGLIGSPVSTAGNGYDPLVYSHTLFYLNGLPPSYNMAANLTNVYLQYGTTIASVPEPTTMLLLGFGLIGLAAGTRRFKK